MFIHVYTIQECFKTTTGAQGFQIAVLQTSKGVKLFKIVIYGSYRRTLCCAVWMPRLT